MNTDRAKQLTDEAITRLTEQLDRGKSEALTAFLKTMARFHRYSFWNSLLIAWQKPDATRVAGFHTWLSLGRHVMRGEKGIAILAPMAYRRKSCGERPDRDTRSRVSETDAPDDTTAAENAPGKLVGFKVVHVFDLSQTEGEELPEFASVRGTPGERAEALKQLVTDRGITLEYSDRMGAALGTSSGGHIRLRIGLTPAEEFATLAHEFAHELLHSDLTPSSRVLGTVELEAEAVACVVCHAVGLDTNTASSDYIQLYQGDRKALEASLAAIRKTSSDILTGLGFEG